MTDSRVMEMINKEGKKRGYENLPKLDDVQAELNRELYNRRFRKLLNRTLRTLVVVAAVAALVATLVLPVLQIAGTSMEPGLNNGDLVALVKTENLKRGDLCAFYYSNRILIKRVIGTPGDYLWLDAEGNVYLNGNPLEEPYVSELALGECDVEFPYQVSDNEYFVMGDHRETSIDSRSSVIGCVGEEQIIGKIICKFWPLTEFTWLQ